MRWLRYGSQRVFCMMSEDIPHGLRRERGERTTSDEQLQREGRGKDKFLLRRVEAPAILAGTRAGGNKLPLLATRFASSLSPVVAGRLIILFLVVGPDISTLQCG